jgi:hypothetical protein
MKIGRKDRVKDRKVIIIPMKSYSFEIQGHIIHHIPENISLHNHRFEGPKSYKRYIALRRSSHM